MTFLVALAMGTMYCVTVIQFIPEALGKTVLMRLYIYIWLTDSLLLFDFFQGSTQFYKT